jgi:hypothetical protein
MDDRRLSESKATAPPRAGAVDLDEHRMIGFEQQRAVRLHDEWAWALD